MHRNESKRAKDVPHKQREIMREGDEERDEGEINRTAAIQHPRRTTKTWKTRTRRDDMSSHGLLTRCKLRDVPSVLVVVGALILSGTGHQSTIANNQAGRGGGGRGEGDGITKARKERKVPLVTLAFGQGVKASTRTDGLMAVL